MMEFTVKTGVRVEMIDITDKIRGLLREAGVTQGVCHIFVPHTTAAVTINENADPAVRRDIIAELEKIAPLNGGYSHSEGNSAAHIKASLIGSSETVFIAKGDLVLGTWQSLFFCEFDGPRTRKIYIQIAPTRS